MFDTRNQLYNVLHLTMPDHLSLAVIDLYASDHITSSVGFGGSHGMHEGHRASNCQSTSNFGFAYGALSFQRQIGSTIQMGYKGYIRSCNEVRAISIPKNADIIYEGSSRDRLTVD